MRVKWKAHVAVSLSLSLSFFLSFFFLFFFSLSLSLCLSLLLSLSLPLSFLCELLVLSLSPPLSLSLFRRLSMSLCKLAHSQVNVFFGRSSRVYYFPGKEMRDMERLNSRKGHIIDISNTLAKDPMSSLANWSRFREGATFSPSWCHLRYHFRCQLNPL